MLTKREQQVLEIIQDFAYQEEVPTLNDIAHKLGIKSKGSVHYYIQSLEKKGYIETPKGKRKHIKVLKSSRLLLPLVGTIAAGQPLQAYEVIETIDFSSLIQTNDRYLLKISGDSMKDSGILDGDLVLIQKQSIARDGQIVVALIDNEEATLKEFVMQDKSTVALIPHNDELTPMLYSASRIKIQGVYLGVRFDKSYLLS
ncbi:transcriptional repressor LexA [Facilibium subflavum]|uniref:transcriptional repressor LexA n=1 Tax=Facilibium subflavum TaxID=2219058 RepID=UPI000E658886|nr:transcriptional repressor LexA [Facilibium subflavum]